MTVFTYADTTLADAPVTMSVASTHSSLTINSARQRLSQTLDGLYHSCGFLLRTSFVLATRLNLLHLRLSLSLSLSLSGKPLVMRRLNDFCQHLIQFITR